MNFLTAHWKNLIAINYKVEKEVLLPFLPFGTELDDYEGNYYVSLIGFMFQNTRVLGIQFPNHVNFEEVNLRFYVKNNNGEKGVVFIKEIVPKPLIKLIANTIYSEHYSVSKMSSKVEQNPFSLKVNYSWKQNNHGQSMAVETGLKELDLIEGSKAEFIAEHYVGFTKINERKTSSYWVEHPKWKQYEVKNYDLEIDFESNYGNGFSFINHQKIDSVFFLKGSEISVSKKQNNLS